MYIRRLAVSQHPVRVHSSLNFIQRPFQLNSIRIVVHCSFQIELFHRLCFLTCKLAPTAILNRVYVQLIRNLKQKQNFIFLRKDGEAREKEEREEGK